MDDSINDRPVFKKQGGKNEPCTSQSPDPASAVVSPSVAEANSIGPDDYVFPYDPGGRQINHQQWHSKSNGSVTDRLQPPKKHGDHLNALGASRDPLVLYSVNTWLAYNICEKFFGNEHYIWCTPDFDFSSKPSYTSTVPPSSCPKEIYYSLAEAVRRNDRHSDKIKANCDGIMKGASVQRTSGRITLDQYAEIEQITQLANVADFRPLLYVIPNNLVAQLVLKVPVDQRAAPLSSEFIIERLPRNYFDVVELR